MDNVNKEVVEFYKKLGYTLIDIKSSVFREEESTLVFQTDNKNHTVDGSTILYDHAVSIHQELQKAREEERERIIYVTQNIKDAFMSPLTERRWLQCIQFTDQPKPKDQSELDQPDALTTLTPKT